MIRFDFDAGYVMAAGVPIICNFAGARHGWADSRRQ
jgi:hypothetical protein